MWTSALGFVLAAFHLQPAASQAAGLPILGPDFWNENGRDELTRALSVKHNTRVAKNAILFIGDGMSANTVVAARIYRAGETSNLVWEKFDHVGLLKTYCNDKMVPDSSVTATAMLSGVKGNRATVGTDGTVKLKDCQASLNKDSWTVPTALLAQQAGKSTGVVTNTRITHATPASAYAHSANRDWECDAKLPEDAKQCKDIARQLIEDDPGRNLNVIMGGGRQGLVSKQADYPGDPIDTGACQRNDSRNLINEWIDRQKNMSAKFAFVNNTAGLKGLDIENVDNLLGIFANSHIPYNYLRDKSDAGPPSLELMATTAVKILSKNPKGFFLMIEGGEIDLGHHKGRAKVALDETVQLHEAVNATVNLLEELNIKDDTLLIVTSDHGHTLSINGYPARGSDILGIADKSETDDVSYTTLMYSVSGADSFQYDVVNGKVQRRDPSKEDTTSWDYHQQAAVLNDENKHDGGDVNVYAIGPMSHLFHHVHEQSYVAHVIQYAMQIGRYSDRSEISSSVAVHWASSALVLLTFLGIRFL